jgi:signal transduction histidine kinase
MDVLQNLDLLFVGVATAATVLLGFTIFYTDKKSITNRTFLGFAIVTAIWDITNYIAYTLTSASIAIIFLRIELFFAVWQAFLIFQLFYVFPKEKFKFNKAYKFLLIPLVSVVSILNLTPLVLRSVTETNPDGTILSVSNGPAIPLFGIVSIFLVISSLFVLIRKILKSTKEEKKPYKLLLTGILIMFFFIIIFNFIFPAFLNNSSYISYGAVFILPFVFFTAYAIHKHRLFNIKDTATVFAATTLSVVTFLEIIFADNLSSILFRSSVFILVLIFSIRLIKNMFALERANEEKSEFMSFASHEIRNPITAMKGYASLMLEGDTGPINPMTKDAAQKIMFASNQVISLIAQYLNKSKMELGELKYLFSIFDVSDTVEEIVRGFQPVAEQKGITVTTNIDKSQKYHVKADEVKIKEVISNTIDNSIKYTPKGGVVVSVEHDGEKVLIKIKDTGVGIPPETIPHLFKKFSRADAQKVNLLGTGLGLFLAKTFIDAHNGRIWAESEGKDKGSTIIIELPAVSA